MKKAISLVLVLSVLALSIPLTAKEKKGADLIEVRLDYMALDVLKRINEFEEIIKKSSIPLIATYRQYEQGGVRKQNENYRIKVLNKAANIGFDYIDIELTTLKLKSTIDNIKDYGSKVIISFHNFEETPTINQMEKIIKNQVEMEADICKLVTFAKDISDNVRCIMLTKKISKITKIVCFAMGKKGKISRALAPLFGASFTYASLEKGLETATGQISIAEMKDLYNKLGITE